MASRLKQIRINDWQVSGEAGVERELSEVANKLLRGFTFIPT